MNIYEKISAIMAEVQYLSKDDRVEFNKTKYKAISEEKVTSSVREKLVKYKLVIFPVKQEHKRDGTLSTVDTTYRIVNAENPEEFIEVVSSGTGADTQDKGVGKAMTYAYKYMLLRTFAIPTGEDPDKISSDEIDDTTSKTFITSDMADALRATVADYKSEHDNKLRADVFNLLKDAGGYEKLTIKQWNECMQKLGAK